DLVNQQYQGELVTPVGTYAVKTGTYADGELQLQLLADGANAVSLRAQFKEQALHGQFTSGDDSGPIELQRTGDARASASKQTSLNLSPQQWTEDIDFF